RGRRHAGEDRRGPGRRHRHPGRHPRGRVAELPAALRAHRAGAAGPARLMALDWPMRFGIFMAPFHPTGQNPTLALERDLELIQWLAELGFEEAWIGEHHSAGYEIIASPEVFIGVAAERTRRLKLGTGGSSPPYHPPLTVADRMVLLDHLTRGRSMLGVGPGQLASDAVM